MGMIIPKIIPNKSGIIPCVIPRKFDLATIISRVSRFYLLQYCHHRDLNIYHTDMIFVPIESSRRTGSIGTKIMVVWLLFGPVATKCWLESSRVIPCIIPTFSPIIPCIIPMAKRKKNYARYHPQKTSNIIMKKQQIQNLHL